MIAPKTRNAWTAAEDDILRDAYIIIGARAKHLKATFSWKLADGICAGHKSRSMQSRMSRLHTKPGEDRYIAELMEAWTEIWLEDRESGELVESDPKAMDGFILVDQINHLRSRIDKSDMHVHLQHRSLQ